jgi:hypothetical protein
VLKVLLMKVEPILEGMEIQDAPRDTAFPAINRTEPNSLGITRFYFCSEAEITIARKR